MLRSASRTCGRVCARCDRAHAPDSVVVERLEASVAEGRLQLLPRDRPAAIAANPQRKKEKRRKGNRCVHIAARSNDAHTAERVSRSLQSMRARGFALPVRGFALPVRACVRPRRRAVGESWHAPVDGGEPGPELRVDGRALAREAALRHATKAAEVDRHVERHRREHAMRSLTSDHTTRSLVMTPSW